jgi:alcohol dehydrogenase (NADP+)
MNLPSIGFGCSPYRSSDDIVDLRDAFEDAWRAGYRLFDSAELYGNETSLGEALQLPGAPPREELFVVSKVWDTNHAFNHAIEACERTLDLMGLEYLDAYMIHSPQSLRYSGPLGFPTGATKESIVEKAYPWTNAGDPDTVDVPISETWGALETLHQRGLVRHLGLCNMEPRTITEVIDTARVSPTLVQVAFSPFEKRTDVLTFCRKRGIPVIGHSPLSPTGLLADPNVQAIAAHHSRTAAQIILRWAVQNGVVPIPSSTRPEHISSNIAIIDFQISESEMKTLDSLEKTPEIEEP